jgi:hypothetical protein
LMNRRWIIGSPVSGSAKHSVRHVGHSQGASESVGESPRNRRPCSRAAARYCEDCVRNHSSRHFSWKTWPAR